MFFFFSSQSSGANYGLWTILNWFCLRWRIWIWFSSSTCEKSSFSRGIFWKYCLFFFFCSVSISDTLVDGLVGFGCMGLYLSPSFCSFTPLTSVPAACHYGTTVWFEVRVCDASKMALSEMDCFDYLGSFVFHFHFWTFFFYFCEGEHWNLHGDCVDTRDLFW